MIDIEDGHECIAHSKDLEIFDEIDEYLDYVSNLEIEGVLIEKNEESALFCIETEFIDSLEILKRGIFVLMSKSKKLKDDIKKYLENI